MSLFKSRNKKIYAGDTRVTLDAKHNEIMKGFKDIKKKLPYKKYDLDVFKNELRQFESKALSKLSDDEIQKMFDLKENIKTLETEINEIETNKHETDYFLKTSDLLYSYYEDIENTATDDVVPAPKKEPAVPKKPKKKASQGTSIMNFFNQNKEETTEKKVPSGKISDFVCTTQANNRASIRSKYLEIVDPNYYNSAEYIIKDDNCANCGSICNLIQTDGIMVCEECGYTEFVLMDSDKPSYRDPPPEASYFAYKRINHLTEILLQVQAKESTEIPQDVYDQIMLEIKKERLTNMALLTNEKVRGYLKKLRLNKYYEHIPHIINKLNGLPPPVIPSDVEEKIKIMFKEIQEPFSEICPKDRKNFLSYNYVLYKFVEMLGHPELKPLFPLLKSNNRLQEQDFLWKKITEKTGMPFIRSL